MVFSSLIFLFIFLPLTLLIYYFAPKTAKNLTILVISLIFYGWGEPVYIGLMVFCIIFNYLASLFISKYHSKGLFISTIIVNIGILTFFKYFGFLIDNLNFIFGLDMTLNRLPLPIGISFYTFQVMSYVIDVYLRKIKVQTNIIDFGAYVTMFPQLIAGPIVQYKDIYKQLKNRNENSQQFAEGIERFILGLGKKVLIANNIGLIWANIKDLPISELSLLSSWLGIIAFSLQIYFDFSGYSDMAIGLGKMFGFEFMENFNYPYISKSVTEFWRRWHISLGNWFREYIYIPLGGNRLGLAKQFRNLFIVWFITGLWHGASWNFVLWGLYFGLFVFLEKIYLGKILKNIPGLFANFYTMIIVIVGWIFFEGTSITYSLQYISVMFGFSGNSLIDNTFIYSLYTNLILLVISIICATPILNKIMQKLKQTYNSKGAILLAISHIFILFLATAYLVNESYNPFLYFRF